MAIWKALIFITYLCKVERSKRKTTNSRLYLQKKNVQLEISHAFSKYSRAFFLYTACLLESQEKVSSGETSTKRQRISRPCLLFGVQETYVKEILVPLIQLVLDIAKST